ncbi:HSP20-like chaperone [Xylariales sp. PMI_506]|nr:HSP20-like chaperone [Xylariales sp. PMI_506]
MSIFAPRSSPYEPSYSGLFRLIDHFDKYHDELGGRSDLSKALERSSLPTFTPKFDLQETPSTYILHGELPGIDKEHINIQFTDEQTLSISGKVEHKEVSTHTEKQQQQQQQQKPKARYWISERSYGEFARSFSFPSTVDPAGVVAKLDNGILNVVVPKAQKPNPRRIEVQ